MKLQIAFVAAALAVAPGLALAQSTTSQGAAEGAATGGQIGGPLGAAVGGTVGAAVGAAVEIPNAVIESIHNSRHPSVVVEEEIVVGRPLPSRVELYAVPNHGEYRYAVVNNQRVIVEPRSRRVLRILN